MDDKIVSILSRKLRIARDTIQPHSLIVENLGADSLDVVDILMELEDVFQIDIPDQDANRIRTVQDLVSYINTRTLPGLL